MQANFNTHTNRLIGVLTIPIVMVLLSGCPLPSSVKAAIRTALPRAIIGTAYSTTLPASGGWTPSGVTVPAGSWLTYTAATGVISGTPGGNDFGAWPVTVTYTNGSEARSVTANIAVGDPTLTVTPPTGFLVPYHSTHTVTITLTPVATSPYTYTYKHNIVNGQANTTLTGPTSTTSTADLMLSWNVGGDFTGEAFLDLVSNAPGRGTLRLGPIPSKSH